MTTRHMKASIEGLLLLSNQKLARLTGMDGKAARKELRERKNKGEKYIPCSDECEGFDPVTGCPGHEDNEPLKQQ